MEIHARYVIQIARSVMDGITRTAQNVMTDITLILIIIPVHVWQIVLIINGEIGRIHIIQYVVCVITHAPDVLARIPGNVLNVKLDII